MTFKMLKFHMVNMDDSLFSALSSIVVCFTGICYVNATCFLIQNLAYGPRRLYQRQQGLGQCMGMGGGGCV